MEEFIPSISPEPFSPFIFLAVALVSLLAILEHECYPPHFLAPELLHKKTFVTMGKKATSSKVVESKKWKAAKKEKEIQLPSPKYCKTYQTTSPNQACA